MKIPAGTYKATINKAFVAAIGAKQTQSFCIEFHITDLAQTITWNGWMSEKAYERTLETLAKLGFDENKPMKSIEGHPSYTADHFEVKSCEIVVELEPDLNDPTKKWPRVKWVNLPTESKFKAPPTSNLPSDFKAQLAGARAKLGIKKSPMTTTGTEEPFPF